MYVRSFVLTMLCVSLG